MPNSSANSRARSYDRIGDRDELAARIALEARQMREFRPRARTKHSDSHRHVTFSIVRVVSLLDHINDGLRAAGQEELPMRRGRSNRGMDTSVQSARIEGMSDERLRQVAAAGLVIGAVLGMVGSFAPSAQLRGLAWGVDGIAIVIASALLVVHHGREGNDQLAAGFLVFLAGETLIVAGSGMELTASAPLFARGRRSMVRRPRPHQRVAADADIHSGYGSSRVGAVGRHRGSHLRRRGPDAAIQAAALLCLSVPGADLGRMGLGARPVSSGGHGAWAMIMVD